MQWNKTEKVNHSAVEQDRKGQPQCHEMEQDRKGQPQCHEMEQDRKGQPQCNEIGQRRKENRICAHLNKNQVKMKELRSKRGIIYIIVLLVNLI